MNRKIDFVLIGAQKAGTTSLYHYLGKHPEIFLPAQKEIPFFVLEEAWEQGDAYLDRFYRELEDEKRVGHAYVHILTFSESADRIRSYNPSMKLIAVLRDPVERAYSAYWYARRNGREVCPTFEEALQREEERISRGDSADKADFGYLTNGRYCDRLHVFFDRFPAENIQIYLTEDLRHRAAEVLEELFDWLDVDPRRAACDVSKRSNVASMPRQMWLQKLLMSRDSLLKRLYRALVPHGARDLFKRRVTSKILERNLQAFSYPPLAAETRERLSAYFQPQVECLSELIGRDLSHWL